jgi:hypothetical protein
MARAKAMQIASWAEASNKQPLRLRALHLTDRVVTSEKTDFIGGNAGLSGWRPLISTCEIVGWISEHD